MGRACLYALGLGVMLLSASCMQSQLGMDSDDSDSRLDPYLDISPDEDGVEISDMPQGNPSDDMEGYAMAQDLEREILDKINRVSRTRSLRLSQVKLLEGQLQKIRESRRWSKAEVRKLKEEVKKNTDIALSDYGTPDLMLKCKTCKRQMGVTTQMLLHLEQDIKMFGGGWHRCDKFGNSLPNAIRYPTLSAFHNAYPNSVRGDTFVHSCVYCYREKDIQRAQQQITNKRREHESLGRAYTHYAKGANRSRNKQKSLTKKQEKVQQEIKRYEVRIESYGEAARLLERQRENALDDFNMWSNTSRSRFCDDF